MAAVVIATSVCGQHALQELALPAIELLVHRLGVAARALRPLQRNLDELRAEAFDLLLDGGPHVVRLHHRAEPPGGRDRLQSGDARAEHQHPAGFSVPAAVVSIGNTCGSRPAASSTAL